MVAHNVCMGIRWLLTAAATSNGSRSSSSAAGSPRSVLSPAAAWAHLHAWRGCTCRRTRSAQGSPGPTLLLQQLFSCSSSTACGVFFTLLLLTQESGHLATTRNTLPSEEGIIRSGPAASGSTLPWCPSVLSSVSIQSHHMDEPCSLAGPLLWTDVVAQHLAIAGLLHLHQQGYLGALLVP